MLRSSQNRSPSLGYPSTPLQFFGLLGRLLRLKTMLGSWSLLVCSVHTGPCHLRCLRCLKYHWDAKRRVQAATVRGDQQLSRKSGGPKADTILAEMLADEFNFLRPEIKNYKAEADADLIPIPGQLELHGRCRCGVLLSACFVLHLLQI